MLQSHGERNHLPTEWGKHELYTAVFRWVHNTVCVDGRAPRGWLWLVVVVVVAVTLVWGWYWVL